MTKLLKPLWVTLLATSIMFVGCKKQVTTVAPTPEPPPPVVEEPPPPPPPPPEPVVEDLSALLNELLQPVYFDFDKFDLKPETINRLERIAGFLREHSNVRLRAEGHADERGSSEYNMGLGENRSKAVKNYLTSYGISSERVDLTSYGEERPSQSNCGSDDDCHQNNRRVEWQVISQ